MATFAFIRTLAFSICLASANRRLDYGKNGIEIFRRWRILSRFVFTINTYIK